MHVNNFNTLQTVTLRMCALSRLFSNTAVQFTTHLLHTTTYTVPSFLFPGKHIDKKKVFLYRKIRNS